MSIAIQGHVSEPIFVAVCYDMACAVTRNLVVQLSRQGVSKSIL